MEAAIEASRHVDRDRARYIIAAALMATQGQGALQRAAMLLDHYAEEGPPEFAEVWCGVTAAIYDIVNRTGSPSGSARH